jgi:hypothetical protein
MNPETLELFLDLWNKLTWRGPGEDAPETPGPEGAR